MLQRAKDVFVLGCTVGLRVNDLLNLKKGNVERNTNAIYIKTFASKTGSYTKIKLPTYAIEILNRQKHRGSYLLKPIGAGNLNNYIKQICELAGWKYTYPKLRSRRGQRVEIYKNRKSQSSYRFCDLVSTHTMRRTAISILLNLGVEENYVRKVSGHSAGSKEFYKYVKYSQQNVDDAIGIAFDKLAKK